MRARSLALRSDLIFARFGGEVLDRGAYLVVRTPSNPAFRWGNFLAFPRVPERADLERWPALFEREFADLPEALAHRAFTWDEPGTASDGIEAFRAAGYAFEPGVVLSTRELVPPPHPNDEAEVRALASDEDWRAATENQIRCRDERDDEASFRVFKERQMASYRRMSEAGLGHWFGAFLAGRLVADLGLFVEHGVGRYQQVVTAPEHRRRGLCGTLVHAAGRHALERLGAEQLVLMAETDGPAARIYTSVGFRETERSGQLELVPGPAGTESRTAGHSA